MTPQYIGARVTRSPTTCVLKGLFQQSQNRVVSCRIWVMCVLATQELDAKACRQDLGRAFCPSLADSMPLFPDFRERCSRLADRQARWGYTPAAESCRRRFGWKPFRVRR